MHFKIPSKVQIGGVDFRVSYVKGLGRNDSRRGETHYFDRELCIDPDLASQDREATFIHEATHAIGDTFDCKLSESQVKRVSQGFYQVLRQLEGEGEDAKSKG